MDPLSISASVAGLVGLISAIISQGYSLVYASKGQSKEIEALLREVSGFGGVLLGLQAHIEESIGSPALILLLSSLLRDEEPRGSETPARHRKSPLSECKSLLTQVEELLTKLKKTNPISRALKWEALSRDLAGLSSKIEHYKATFILCFSLENSTQLNKSLDLQKEIAAELSSIRLEQKRVEDEAVTQRTLQQRSALLKWLGQTPEAKHKDSLSLRHKGTGSWLLEREEYVNWVSAEGLSLFWLNGTSGSGKTILVSTVIDHLQNFYMEDKTKGLAYYYFDFLQDQSLTPARLIGSLASQLLCQTTGTSTGESKAFQLFSGYESKSVYPNMNQVEELFLSVASGFSSTFVILDGIDEYADRAEILDFLGRLTTLDFELKILVASRRSSDLVKNFQYFRSVTISPSDIENDVDSYIRASLARLRHQSTFQSVEGVQALKQGANGMFLWITCQLDDIARSRTKVKSLSALPRGLGETYQNILSHVDDDDKLLQRRILRLLLFARRPLDLCEVVEGIAIDTEILHQAEIEQSLLCSPEDIFEICGSLVRRSETTGKVQLAHHSVREFLMSPSMRNSVPNEFFISDKESVEIAKTCLSYLSLEEFNSARFKRKMDGESVVLMQFKIDDNVADSSFLEYAAVNWWEHLPQSEMEMEMLWPLISRFFDRKRGNFSNWVGIAQYMFDEYRYPSSMTPLHVCAMHGLVHLGRRLLEEGHSPDCVTTDLRTPLHIALENRENLMTYLLIGHKAALDRPSRNGRRPLDLAIESGNEAAVKALLRGGCDANLCLPSGEFPLSIAVQNRWEAVVPALLSKTKPDLCLRDGRTVVHLAAEIGSEEILKILSKSADLARTDKNGWTAAHFAAHNGHTHVLELLLSKGADPCAEDMNGWTPLHAAISQRHLKASVILLKAGGNDEPRTARSPSRFSRAGRVGVSGKYSINSEPHGTSGNSGSSSTNSATDIPSPLYLAVFEGFIEGVEVLLEMVKRPPDITRCLEAAVSLPDTAIAGLLLPKAEAFSINEVLPKVLTTGRQEHYLLFLQARYNAQPSLETHPVFHAIVTKNHDCLQLLFEKGAVTHFKSMEGCPLHFAATYRNSDAAKFLLERGDDGDVNAKNVDGRTPLHIIAASLSSGSFVGETRELVELLITFGSDMYELDSLGQSALQLGVLSGNVEFVDYLLSVGIASIHDNDGNTLLHTAVESGSAAMLGLLLKISSDGTSGLRSENSFTVDNVNNRGETPLLRAVAKERLDLVSILLTSEAQVSIQDNLGRTPLHIAALGEGYSTIAPLLIAAGAREDSQDNSGKTPPQLMHEKTCNDLYQAIISPQPALVLALLEKGADTNFQIEGSSFLHAAVNIQSRRIMNHLLNHGADVNAQDMWGKTPLHIAVVKSSSLAELLIQRGAELDILDSSWRTPVDLASSVNSPELESLFKGHGIDLSKR